MNSETVYTATADTLSGLYTDKWDGPAIEESNIFIQFMSSNDLIFVVLAVSLIIWAVLAFYMIKVDKNISKIEQKIAEQNNIIEK
jgi:predicted acyltransferase